MKKYIDLSRTKIILSFFVLVALMHTQNHRLLSFEKVAEVGLKRKKKWYI